jgi:hypothetical protein
VRDHLIAQVLIEACHVRCRGAEASADRFESIHGTLGGIKEVAVRCTLLLS